jgi:hypothetical protein
MSVRRRGSAAPLTTALTVAIAEAMEERSNAAAAAWTCRHCCSPGGDCSRQEGKERISDVSNLAELDRGRAVVLASGAPATLIRTLPWYTGSHKDAVEDHQVGEGHARGNRAFCRG